MCSICKDILKDFGIAHTESLCPLRNSRYCSHCAKYGHLTTSCPARPSVLFREPAFLEQLIPASELDEFKITSRTPLSYTKPEEPQRYLEIKENDKVISAYLSARSIKTPKGHTKKRTLEEYAALDNRRVIYLS
jgi:hypothetical protein